MKPGFFIVDDLNHWKERSKDKCHPIDLLIINLDNGPHNSIHRTHFMKRLNGFAYKHDLNIVLAYFPSYHNKYNPSCAIGEFLKSMVKEC